MSQNDAVDALYRRFVALCEAYSENPELLTGLALDEAAGQFERVCASQLRDPAMQELLHRLLAAIPRGDMAEFHRLFDAIRSAALEHDLA